VRFAAMRAAALAPAGPHQTDAQNRKLRGDVSIANPIATCRHPDHSYDYDYDYDYIIIISLL
jgi:hypothetical protein